MGAACCVAANDRTILSGSGGETLRRHVQYSPSWSFRWDSRGRVAGEESQANWLHDRGGGNYQVEVKSGTTVETSCASEEGLAGAGFSHPLPVKLSPPGSSVSTSPQSSQSHTLPTNSTPSRRYRQSPSQQLYKSSTFSISGKASFESTWGSNSKSSGSWAIPVFSDLTTTRRQRWSFDSGNSGFSPEKLSSSDQNSESPSIELQTCGICSNHLTERSSWGWTSQKILSTNELAVVSVLACGHVYHAECLEYLTPEINKYDPVCPACTHGDKWAVKMFKKPLKAVMGAKARKGSRKRVVDTDPKSSIWFDRCKIGGVEETCPKTSSDTKPFLKRHFSFSSKAGKDSPENPCAQRKGFFWARSSKRAELM